MDAFEALKKLYEGYSVRYKHWVHTEFLKKVGVSINVYRDETFVGTQPIESLLVNWPNNWELYEGKVPFHTIKTGEKFQVTKELPILTKITVTGVGQFGMDERFIARKIFDNHNELVFKV